MTILKNINGIDIFSFKDDDKGFDDCKKAHANLNILNNFSGKRILHKKGGCTSQDNVKPGDMKTSYEKICCVELKVFSNYLEKDRGMKEYDDYNYCRKCWPNRPKKSPKKR